MPLNPTTETADGSASSQGAVFKETVNKPVSTDEGSGSPRGGATGSSVGVPVREKSHDDAVRDGLGSGLELEPISPANPADDLLNASPRNPGDSTYDAVTDFDESLLDD